MRPVAHNLTRALTLTCISATLACWITGCGLLGKPGVRRVEPTGSSPASPGERPGRIPAGRQHGGLDPAASPQRALTRFAGLYVNWTYKDLVSHERRLAAIAIGPARQAELQAAAQASADSTLRRAQIFNRGSIVAIAADRHSSRDRYVVVTRQQTGGRAGYAGLQAAYEVTLATLTRVPGGFAVSQWTPVG